MTEKYTCQINKDQSFEIKLQDGVFHPTGTSDEIIKAVSVNIVSPGKVLDLGCGSGVVGFALHILGKLDGTLYASDLSQDATLLIEENARNLNIPVISRQGSIFEPWENESFDYIIDDISGIAERVAEISPWFSKTSCISGEDGTDLVIEAINNAPEHLNLGGKFFFPVLSLSKADKIIETANTVFTKVTKVAHKKWRLPDEMKVHMDTLVDLRSKGLIHFEEKYGWLLWSTDVYMAESPK
jgi:cyclopropane fatty-acyl-phospholipid synthase-like methyltransferase